MARFRCHVTYANVIATLALFLALGGGAYAATQLPKDSVGSKQIKANAVSGSKVKDQSLLAGDFKKGQLPAGPKGDQGIQGTQGIQGIQGNQGVPGEPATKLFAHASAFGGLSYGSGAVSATRNGAAGSGTYTVTFNRNLSGCVALASAGTGEGGTLPSQFSPGVVATASISGNTVLVETTSGSTHNDYDFHVAVFC
jgi:hypothetical protein